ncbi:P-loop containing nucleoside triphosphate hydrolase protein [Boletus edulis BED1]|uniref:P-loop containing nucleoside triphosphate hydrolase protein n=1 Tax=Boletus edulis BED1 TaxID=1328754 RepID=A0AAD4BVP4_BOLED|nr:P-loop containing nucleoside triphosphate hydrolase protein [Boletus edulis BED1]
MDSPHPNMGPETTPRSQISEEHAMVNIEDVELDDIVIAVIGPTGSGKSTFVRLASGHDVQRTTHTLTSFTNDILAIRFRDQESGRHVVLVDTPGFDDAFKSDLDILNMISDWLNSSYKKGLRLSGILYLHRITDNRMAGTLLKNLRVFRKLCGKDALDKVYLTTTMWDEVDQSTGERRLEELETEYWRSMVMQGAQVVRCQNDEYSAKKIIQQIVSQEAARKGVVLQRQMTNLRERKEIELEMLVEGQIELLTKIDKARKAASDASVLEELQKEYDDLAVKVDDKLCQKQKHSSSWLEDFLRFFLHGGK